MLRLLDRLDERQVRLGYVNCVVLVAGRHLDTRTALRHRFDRFVFRKVKEGSAEADEFAKEIDDDGWATFEHQARQRGRERGGAKSARERITIRPRPSAADRFHYVSHLWLVQRCMPSHLGPLAPDRSEVFLEHAKHLGFLAETYALTELGHILRQFLLDLSSEMREGRATPNPLYVRARLAVAALFMWSLLENDALTPFLLREIASRKKNDPELLVGAADALIDSFSKKARIDSAMELRYLRDYRTRVGKGASPAPTPPRRRAQGSATRKRAPAGFKIHRHHVRVRLEHYVDLGLLGRRRTKNTSTIYQPEDITLRAIDAWHPLLDEPRRIKHFLDNSFFSGITHMLGEKPIQCTPPEALRFFARGFELVGREIGFTPGRSVALAASALALEHGKVLEINQAFDAVYGAAKTDLGEHLIFSGGSRFDREFMVRVDPGLARALAQGDADKKSTEPTRRIE